MKATFLLLALLLTGCGRPEQGPVSSPKPPPAADTTIIPTPAPDMSSYNACVSSACSGAHPADPRSMAACKAAYSSCQK